MSALFARVWEGWKAVARRVGEFQSRLVLTILYLILIGPLAVLLQAFSDPLRLKAQKKDCYWLKRDVNLSSLEEARRQ